MLIDTLPYWYVDDVFTFQDFGLFNGSDNSVTFTLSPSAVLASADTSMLGVIAITPEEIAANEEELGEDPSFTLEAIPDNIVSSATEKIYTLTANEDVFWKISSVKSSGTASTSDGEDDDRTYLRINLEAVHEDEAAPSNYGKEATITVRSIAGYTPKGDYDISIQKSADDGDEWTDAGTLKFTAADGENSNGNGNNAALSSNGGCNAGFTFLALGIALSTLIFRHKAL